MARTIVIGTLCWSEDSDCYIIETDDEAFWALELSQLMLEPVDRMSYTRVMVEGGLTGPATIAVSAIVEAE